MRRYQVTVGGRLHVVDVQELSAHQFQVVVEGRELEVTLSDAEDVPETVITPEIAPSRATAPASTAPFRPPAADTLPPMVPATLPPLPPTPDGERGVVKAPMPGTITAVESQAGDPVQAGQVLLKLEAMKMVNAIRAPHDGVVGEVHVRPGQSVGYGHVLVTLKEA